MTSKKLGAILRSVPPATAMSAESAEPQNAAAAPSLPLTDETPVPIRAVSRRPATNPEVPLQVLIPARYCAVSSLSWRRSRA